MQKTEISFGHIEPFFNNDESHIRSSVNIRLFRENFADSIDVTVFIDNESGNIKLKDIKTKTLNRVNEVLKEYLEGHVE